MCLHLPITPRRPSSGHSPNTPIPRLGSGIRETLFGSTVPILLLLLFLLVSVGPSFGQKGEEDEDTASEIIEVVPPETAPQAAKEAFVLLTANQERVLGLGYDGFAGLDPDTGFPTEESELRDAEIDKARRSVDLTSRLVASAGQDMISGFLREMQLTQNMLVGMIEHGGTTAGDMTASELVLRFGVAEREAGALIPISWTERSAILRKYGKLLNDDGSIDSSLRIRERPDAYEADLPPMTYEEYQKKQSRYQDWLKEQQRVQDRERQAEADKRRRAAERRRRQETAGEKAAPKVGVRQGVAPRQEVEKPDPALAKAMSDWQIGWSRKSEPFKKALKQFLPMDLERRNQALIRACQSLYQISAQLVQDPVLEAPDPIVASGLAKAVAAFEAAGEHCLYKRPEQAAEQVERARGALGVTGQRLRFYGLEF